MVLETPDDKREFDQLMLGIDRELTDQGVLIWRRPFYAWMEVCKRFGISDGFGWPGNHYSLRRNPSIMDRVSKWYEERYGDRIKVDIGPGRMAVLIDGNVWTLRLPRIFGTIRFFASRAKSSTRMRGPMSSSGNIIDFIEGLPDGLRSSLSDAHMSQIMADFILGFDGFRAIESLTRSDLAKSAIADVAISVEHLLARNPEYGLSKWASLQAAEKTLKAAIQIAGGTFSKTHKLGELAERARAVGLALDIDHETASIQCDPGIRYAQEPCSLKDAIGAHHAVFSLAIKVVEASGGKATP